MKRLALGLILLLTESQAFAFDYEVLFEETLGRQMAYQEKNFSTGVDAKTVLLDGQITTKGTEPVSYTHLIPPRPLILLGSMWEGLLKWMEENPLKRSLVDQKDFNQIILVRSVDEVIARLEPEIEAFYAKALAKAGGPVGGSPIGGGPVGGGGALGGTGGDPSGIP